MLRHEFAEVNGIRLHYATAGQGRLMLFAHGFPDFWYGWKHQIEEFRRDFRTVTPDLRGYNLSSKPGDPEQYRTSYLVEDLRALHRHLGAEKMILVGHDWGGAIVCTLAALHPHLVERLVLINAPHPAILQRELRENPKQQQASQYMLIFRASQAESILAANNYQMLVDNVLGEGLARGTCSEEEKQTYLTAWAQPGALTGGLNYYRAARIGPPASDGDLIKGYLAEDFSKLKIHMPTLVIWGDQDPYLVASNLDGLEEYIPDLTVKRIPEGAHWVIHDNPEVVNAAMREFISRTQRHK